VEDSAVALVTDAKTYTGSFTPFERPPDAVSVNSFIPRGVRRFFIDEATDAKPINDTLNLTLTCTLPTNFAYILTKFNYRLSVDTVSDFDPSLTLGLFNHIPGQPIGSEEWTVATTLTTKKSAADPARIVTTVDLSRFSAPFWSAPTGVATCLVNAVNLAAPAAAAGSLATHLEFLEYDLTQAQRYWINTRIPTMG
jgi:hypothetical protein